MSIEWDAVVGLEIHVHLKTRTKMFCRCEFEYFGEPNTRTCPVCLAHPGALPVANRKAVDWTIKLGLALGCDIADEAVFSRKNYFYPDNPKGYQISQYDRPLCVGGSLLVPGSDADREIGFVRAHLEEDAAKTVHVGGTTGRKVGSEHSLIDFNRGGTPRVETVTHPELRGARIVRLREELGAATAQTLVTGGLDTLWASTRDEGAEPVATANVIANQLVGAGVDPKRVDPRELAKLVAARNEIPRKSFDEAIAHL